MTAVTRTVVIASEAGLHARPAKTFAQAAKESGVAVTLARGEATPVDAASILGVMSIGAVRGDTVTLSADGAGAQDVIDALAEILTTDHDAK